MKNLCFLLVLLLSLTLACAGPSGDSGAGIIEAGPDAQETIQTALLLAEPGSVIELAAGRFDLNGSLSLDVANVTIRGAGSDQTILDFTNQEAGTGGEGIALQATGDGRRVLYIAHESHPKDFTGVDVTDPRNPRVVVQTELPHDEVRSNSLALVGDLLLVAYQTARPGLTPAGVAPTPAP